MVLSFTVYIKAVFQPGRGGRCSRSIREMIRIPGLKKGIKTKKPGENKKNIFFSG